jgi:hypothetical protein
MSFEDDKIGIKKFDLESLNASRSTFASKILS